MGSDAPVGGTEPLTADVIVETASRIVEEQGTSALTMRRLADEVGVAVTSIYWHVGDRQELLDAVVDRLVVEMGTVEAIGATARDRIASLAHQLRTKLLERPHLVGLAHEQAKTALIFQPVQAAIAAELAGLGLRGEAAALCLRALQVHVVGSVLLERTLERYPDATPGTIDADAWLRETDDAELVAALERDVDRVKVFELGLEALLVALPQVLD